MKKTALKKDTNTDEIPFFLSPGLPFHPSSREGTGWALAFGAEVTWVLPGQSNLQLVFPSKLFWQVHFPIA